MQLPALHHHRTKDKPEYLNADQSRPLFEQETETIGTEDGMMDVDFFGCTLLDEPMCTPSIEMTETIKMPLATPPPSVLEAESFMEDSEFAYHALLNIPKIQSVDYFVDTAARVPSTSTTTSEAASPEASPPPPPPPTKPAKPVIQLRPAPVAGKKAASPIKRAAAAKAMQTFAADDGDLPEEEDSDSDSDTSSTTKKKGTGGGAGRYYRGKTRSDFPTEQAWIKYRDKRDRNNAAANKSRAVKRGRVDEVFERKNALERENTRLREQVARLEDEVAFLRKAVSVQARSSAK